ncbi:hypothetical protein [Pseudanabaena sp. UWO311]|uniref:hypothetical protein n=1 Tax=Pseudanabaena sp. UWO311 TaxID=2487337 RepID=UPI001680C49B|nr:hypothetical protein [Pseudanabaena sp. UWO311]
MLLAQLIGSALIGRGIIRTDKTRLVKQRNQGSPVGWVTRSLTHPTGLFYLK